jgi:transaldolase
VKTLARPNVFIKVPATAEGLPSIQELISEGINVNVTLLFGLPRYRQVADAYLNGLAARAAHGNSLNYVASVASFFVSRIDSLIDPLLESIIVQGGRPRETGARTSGYCQRKKAYQIYKEIFCSERFKELAAQGVRAQRLLWASTSTKNPGESDVKYVEALIGPDTVNTTPLETLDAYRDHGHPKARLEQGVGEARNMLERLSDLGISLDHVTQQLEDDRVETFNKPFDKILQALANGSSRT